MNIRSTAFGERSVTNGRFDRQSPAWQQSIHKGPEEKGELAYDHSRGE